MYQLKIIASCDDPVFPGNESSSADRHICDIECPQQQLCFVIVYVRFAIIQSTQNPIFSRVKVNCLDAIGPTRQELLDFCSLYLERQCVSAVTKSVRERGSGYHCGGRKRELRDAVMGYQTELLLRWPKFEPHFDFDR